MSHLSPCYYQSHGFLAIGLTILQLYYLQNCPYFLGVSSFHFFHWLTLILVGFNCHLHQVPTQLCYMWLGGVWQNSIKTISKKNQDLGDHLSCDLHFFSFDFALDFLITYHFHPQQEFIFLLSLFFTPFILVLVVCFLTFCALVSCHEYLLQFLEYNSDGIFFHVETFLSILFFSWLLSFFFNLFFFFLFPLTFFFYFYFPFHFLFFSFFFLDYFQPQKFHLPSLFFPPWSLLLSQ